LKAILTEITFIPVGIGKVIFIRKLSKLAKKTNVTLSCGIVKSMWWLFWGKRITIKLQKGKRRLIV